MIYINQNFCLFRLSNLSIITFEFSVHVSGATAHWSAYEDEAVCLLAARLGGCGVHANGGPPARVLPAIPHGEGADTAATVEDVRPAGGLPRRGRLGERREKCEMDGRV